MSEINKSELEELIIEVETLLHLLQSIKIKLTSVCSLEDLDASIKYTILVTRSDLKSGNGVTLGMIIGLINILNVDLLTMKELYKEI